MRLSLPFASCCLSFLVLSPIADAQAQTFTSARFGAFNYLERIEISPDDLPRGTNVVAVRCQGFVEVHGDLTDYHCISDHNYAHRKIIAAVIDAIPMQNFEPAKVDGKDARVLMNFAVLVQCSTEDCVTIPIRNHGYHLEEYGLSYVDPQPILPDDGWYEGFDYKLDWLRDWMPNVRRIDRWPQWDRLSYTISVEVDSEGKAYDACLYATGSDLNFGLRSVQINLERAVDSLEATRFIPGFRDAEPTTMHFYESSVTSDEDKTRLPEDAGPFPDIRCEH